MSVEILIGDSRERLRELPDGSVHCCVTSPPYFGLRDYGVDGQMGLEPTPSAFVAGMVDLFREVRRVLRDDGTLWLNLGDSYASDTKWGGSTSGKHVRAQHGDTGIGRRRTNTGLKQKDLIGIPWRVAFALQDDGWYLRQDIVWHKPNPMPESVRDRCTKAHEYLFLLSKSPRYHYDADAIAEGLAPASIERLSQDVDAQQGSDRVPGKTNGTMKAVGNSAVRPQTRRAYELAEQHGLTADHIAAIRAVGITDAGKAQVTQDGFGKNDASVAALAAEAKAVLGGYYREFLIAGRRNKRSVWTVPTMPFSGAHFATFPPALIEPCILAGCPVGGTVLDPFGGAGTTGMVAERLGRNAVLIELNPEYADLARDRLRAELCQVSSEAPEREHDAGPLFGSAAA